MNMFNKILQKRSSSVPSKTRWINSGVGHFVCSVVVVGFVLCGGSAVALTPYNVLVNPGAETGDLTGWQVNAAVGYVYAVSTNGGMAGVTNTPYSTNQFLAHSGSHTFQMFNTTGPDFVAIYQDFAAISNSLWSASCWAICYASNYPTTGNAHMQVAFYDTNNAVIPYTNISSSGVLGTDFIDPTPQIFWWLMVPPPANDPSGWFFLQPTNLYSADPATEANYDTSLQGLTVLTAPVGTAYVRYQLQFDNPSSGGGDVYFDDCTLTKLNQSDPDITNAPVAVSTYKSLNASFTVVATHNNTYPQEKFKYQWQYNGTNLPPAGGVNDIAGATTNATLNLTNVQVADGGMYSVVVTLTSGGVPTNSIRSVPVPLTVLALTPLQKANLLGPNGGFEGGPTWSPWQPFNGGYLANTNQFYGSSTEPVNAYEGQWVALAGANGDRDNGFHNDWPVTPGQWLKASGMVYLSSSNDFLAGNTCRLQVWFKDAVGSGGNPVPGTSTLESCKIYGWAYTNSDMQYVNIDTSSPNLGQTMYHTMLPRDQWLFMPVTNVVNNAGVGIQDDLPWTTLPSGCFMVPTNTTPAVGAVSFQVYEYCPGGPGYSDIDPITGNPTYPGGYLGSATSATYWDQMLLLKIYPVTNLTASASVSDHKFNLSFSARAGLSYAIQYTSNLGGTNWSTLMVTNAPMSWQNDLNAANDTFYPLTVSDSLTAAQSRFYRIQSQ